MGNKSDELDFSQSDSGIFDATVQKLQDETRRVMALNAAASAFPGGMFHSVGETDRGVLELARSFEKYLKSG